ncbi:3-methyl-2-oxobutanoate hydroxymethyltransferase [Alcanivorax sp. 1008]|uniref:3-methyl-2-oxobutanoate hydroxymethyltransferase n=1 Tax=Alcanivorax sp. 1008 TaxID=2816853 RepID=UPI001D30B3DE|nr:3-methyl-2-oxobutanoate hydroxymethyltransferase [Alcanivorax sp. 1008]MCC1497891.1 3-methyl-2-oxobutanoate hydroxymethyltransferase [Alcanivorax sp. 1008]
MAVTVRTLQQRKQNGEKFSVLTAYDACFSRLISEAGVDVMLVGDSLGMVLQGHDSTLPVTTEQLAYHTSAVARGNQGSLIMADMPFMSGATVDRALTAAHTLMQAGANLVKLEGAGWLAETISVLKRNGVPVCAHLGLTPQSVNTLGGYRVQGREKTEAEQLIEDARLLEQAGADILLLECVPRDVSAQLCQSVQVPVIGIGAGPECDGQVLVMHDMLGITPGKPARFVRNFASEGHDIRASFAAYDKAVKDGSFPASEHCF